MNANMNTSHDDEKPLEQHVPDPAAQPPQKGPIPAGLNPVDSGEAPPDSGSDPARGALEELLRHERVVIDNLPHVDKAAEALKHIHDKELFRHTHRSFGRYVEERLSISRSRAYQLIHFQRAKEQANSKGERAPVTEREARAAKRLPASHADRLARYLRDVVAKVPPGSQRALIEHARAVLADLERNLPAQEVQSDVALAPAAPALPAPKVSVATPNPVQPSTSSTGQTTRPVVASGGGLPPNSTPPAPVSTDRSATAQPEPHLGHGGHFGLTMEEARRMGLPNQRAGMHRV
jgi:hypothetical protein